VLFWQPCWLESKARALLLALAAIPRGKHHTAGKEVQHVGAILAALLAGK
jgi:hypothetical protein